MRPLAAVSSVSAASSAGVRDCLTPHMDRRQVFEDDFREKTLQQLKKRGQGGGAPLDPGFAFGVSTQGDHETIKALLSHSQASDRDTKGPRPHRRHSQGLRLPPSHVFGQGKHAGQYKGGASDGVAGVLTYVDGGELAARQHQQQHGHHPPDRVFGLRSRRDEAGSMKACLQGDEQHDGELEQEERRRAQQQEQAERRLAAAAALGDRGRTRAAAKGTAATLLAPSAVGLAAEDDAYVTPRSKEEVRRIFLVRLGEQCGLKGEDEFERVFARAAASEAGYGYAYLQAKGGPPRCSIRAFRAALDAEKRVGIK